MFNNTKAVFTNLIREINLSIFVINLVSRILFLGFYGYLIYNNFNDLILFVIYVILASLSFLWLLYYSTTYHFNKEQKKVRKKIRDIFKYISWLLRATIIGYNFYLITYVKNPTDLDKIILVVSSIILLADIAYELIASFLVRHYRLIMYAAGIDYNETPIIKKIGSAFGADRYLDKEKDAKYEKAINKIVNRQYLEESIKSHLDGNNHLTFGEYKIKKNKFVKLIAKYRLLADAYLISPTKLNELNASAKENRKYLKDDDMATVIYDVLLFFLNNHIKGEFEGLSHESMKIVTAALLFYNKENDFPRNNYKKLALSIFVNDISLSRVIKEASDLKSFSNSNKKKLSFFKRNKEEKVDTEYLDYITKQIELLRISYSSNNLDEAVEAISKVLDILSDYDENNIKDAIEEAINLIVKHKELFQGESAIKTAYHLMALANEIGRNHNAKAVGDIAGLLISLRKSLPNK